MSARFRYALMLATNARDIFLPRPHEEDLWNTLCNIAGRRNETVYGLVPTRKHPLPVSSTYLATPVIKIESTEGTIVSLTKVFSLSNAVQFNRLPEGCQRFRRAGPMKKAEPCFTVFAKPFDPSQNMGPGDAARLFMSSIEGLVRDQKKWGKLYVHGKVSPQHESLTLVCKDGDLLRDIRNLPRCRGITEAHPDRTVISLFHPRKP